MMMMRKPWSAMLSKTSAAAATATTTLGLWAGVFAPPAAALPGQCWSSPFGGFCDTAPMQDGSFQHCITYGSSSFCTQACHNYATNQAVPTDMDPNTPC
jgi:hypothetical protein